MANEDLDSAAHAAEHAQQYQQTAAARQEIDTELDSLARDMALALSHPGLRNKLRQTVKKTRTREGILGLEEFIGNANLDKKIAKEARTDKQLEKIKKSKRKLGQQKLLDILGTTRLDLYFPVPEHRAKWNGSSDLLVTYAGVVDENAAVLPAWSAKTGKRVMLSQRTEWKTPVLVIATEEHESHELPDNDVRSRSIPEEVVLEDLGKTFVGSNPENIPVPQEPGNSRYGIYYFKLNDDHEPRSRGLPEIYIYLSIRKGNECVTRRLDCSRIELEGLTIRTWTDNYCPKNNPTSVSQYFSTSSSYGNKVYYHVYEHDGGSKTYHLHSNEGAICEISKHFGDDYVDDSKMYLDNMTFNIIYPQKTDTGDTDIWWKKVH